MRAVVAVFLIGLLLLPGIAAERVEVRLPVIVEQDDAGQGSDAPNSPHGARDAPPVDPHVVYAGLLPPEHGSVFVDTEYYLLTGWQLGDSDWYQLAIERPTSGASRLHMALEADAWTCASLYRLWWVRDSIESDEYRIYEQTEVDYGCAVPGQPAHLEADITTHVWLTYYVEFHGGGGHAFAYAQDASPPDLGWEPRLP